MSSPSMIPDLSGSFGQPQNPDQTSSPAVQLPNAAGVKSGTASNPVVQALTRKKKPFGSNVRNPGALKAAIARSKRPYQSGNKWRQP